MTRATDDDSELVVRPVHVRDVEALVDWFAVVESGIGCVAPGQSA